MNLIPNQYYPTSSSAEKKVFDILRRVELPNSVAFHSLNLPGKVANKRMGEADFLIVAEKGIIVLEVKGGRIACKNGAWKTIDRLGNEYRLRESPFVQAKEAMYYIEKKIYDKFPNLRRKKCMMGYGVVFPDCRFDISSSEWDMETLADGSSVRNMQKWLENLMSYWKAKTPHIANLEQAELKELRSFLRPDFEVGIDLFSQCQGVEQSLRSFTEDQMMFLDTVSVNEQVIVRGGAGTGKTFLAVELAKRLSSNEQKIGLICYSEWLKNYLQSFNLPNTVVSTLDGIGMAAKRADIEEFDTLIIDEGQDLMNVEALDKIESYLKGGFNNGKWYFFHDANHQSSLIGEYSREAEELLMTYSPTNVLLRLNCRNTKQIVEELQRSTDAEEIEPRNIEGPKVKKLALSDNYNLQDFLLEFLTNNPDFSTQDIVILGPNRFIDSSAFAFRNGQVHIRGLDAFAGQNSYSGVGYATIGEYKGLESRVVALIDMDECPEDLAKNYMYVGISRARVSLYILSRVSETKY